MAEERPKKKRKWQKTKDRSSKDLGGMVLTSRRMGKGRNIRSSESEGAGATEKKWGSRRKDKGATGGKRRKSGRASRLVGWGGGTGRKKSMSPNGASRRRTITSTGVDWGTY